MSTSKPRQQKTPKQRAQEQLDVADRLVKKLAAKRAHLDGESKAVVAEHQAAVVRRDYLAKHPDLQTTITSTPDRSTTP